MREPRIAKPRNYRKKPKFFLSIKSIGFIYTNRDQNVMSKLNANQNIDGFLFLNNFEKIEQSTAQIFVFSINQC